jgi:RNA polymerase sigma-70 factor (ECF subfamily)
MSPDPGSRWLHAHLDAARAGSTDALGGLLEGYRSYLLLIANHEAHAILRPILAAQLQFVQFRGQSAEELAGWLRSILLNCLIDASRYFRSDKRDIQRERSLDDDSRHNLCDSLPAPNPSPDQLLLDDEDAQRVRAALEQLPAHYAQVILLRARDGLDFEEVGRRLGRSVDGARMLYERARARVRQLLEATDAG